MGYRKQSTLYKLIFEKYDGFEVYVKSMSVGDLMELSSVADSVKAEDLSQSMEQSNKMLETFANHLVKWNLEDEDGKEIPATLEGIKSQEMPFVIEIILEWMNQVAQVDENLVRRPNTMPNLASLPMETLNLQP